MSAGDGVELAVRLVRRGLLSDESVRQLDSCDSFPAYLSDESLKEVIQIGTEILVGEVSVLCEDICRQVVVLILVVKL